MYARVPSIRTYITTGPGVYYIIGSPVLISPARGRVIRIVYVYIYTCCTHAGNLCRRTYTMTDYRARWQTVAGNAFDRCASGRAKNETIISCSRYPSDLSTAGTTAYNGRYNGQCAVRAFIYYDGVYFIAVRRIRCPTGRASVCELRTPLPYEICLRTIIRKTIPANARKQLKNRLWI